MTFSRICNANKSKVTFLVQKGASVMKGVNPFQPSVTFHIETRHLFSSAYQVTGFCMKRNTGLKGLTKHVQ